MSETDLNLESLIEQSLRFDHVESDVSQVDFPFTTGWRSLPCGVFNQWHHVKMLVEIENGPRVTAQDSQGILIGPAIRHRLTVSTPGHATCRWSHVQFNVLDSLDAFSLLDMPLLIDRAAADKMGDVSEELFSLQPMKGNLSLGVIAQRKELAFRLLTLICSVSSPRAASLETIRNARRVLPCLRYVQHHLAGPITRKALATQMGLSPTRFHVVFSNATGRAPMDYVRQLRVQNAQRLLLETTLSVKEIGERIGFHDPFHFSRMFKSAVGQSPAGYRRQTQSSIFAGRK